MSESIRPDGNKMCLRCKHYNGLLPFECEMLNMKKNASLTWNAAKDCCSKFVEKYKGNYDKNTY